MSKLKVFIKKPFYVKLMLIKALFYSGLYRHQMLHKPFAKVSKKLGTLQAETPYETINSKYIKDVKWVVGAVCRRTPWESKCMIQAMTAKKLLNSKNLPCTLYMGVSKDENGKLIAHAWLRCGTAYVTGGKGDLIYTVTTKYADIF